MKNKSSSTQVVYHVFLPLWFYAMICGIIIAVPCCLVEWLNNLSHGVLLRWANEWLVSYWHFLNAACSLVGWRYGFGFFWNNHPFFATTVFVAIPTVGGIAIFLVLKRARLTASIILLLYAWHYGLSTFVNTPTQWMTLLIVVVSTLSLLWSFRLVSFIRSACIGQKGRDCFNNIGDGLRSSFSNNDRHCMNEDIFNKQVF